MSIRTFIKRLNQPILNSGPEIWTDNHCLYARTARISRLLSLGSYSKMVVADRGKKQVEISVTTFWTRKSKKYIAFDDIEYIDISEREIINAKGFALDINEKSGFGGRTPTQIYYVQLRTKSSPYPVNLFEFVDEGTADWGGFGIFANDSDIEPEGPQKKAADNYAGLLADFSGAQLWRDRHVQLNFDPNDSRECSKCGHRISLNASRCIYCGHQDASHLNSPTRHG